MIQAYRRENTRYGANGDMALLPEKCVLKAKLNGAWVLELSHPIDEEGRWRCLEEEAVVCAPTFQGKKQLFRISRIEKEDGGVLATAYPVFFDSADDHFLMDVRPEAKNGQQALDIMTAGSRYSGSSDITTVSTAYFVRRNLMDAINGEEEPTFIQRWGGEILYDNFTVIINEKVGGDYGTEIRYGKNMAGIEEEVDMSDVVTRIVPVAYNGHMMSGDAPWVDSPHISKYAKIYTREIKFEDVKMEADAQEGGGEDGCVICKSQEELDAALEQKCREQYGAGIDLPSVSIRVGMADISRTEEYKGYEGLETVRLGDTVFCRNKRLDITTAERAVEIEWDCIRDCVSEVTLGDGRKECFSGMASAAARVDSVVRSDGSIMAERIRGFLDAMETQLRFQKNIAQRQDVRAILFEDVDEESPSYGAMCLGTQGFQISNRRTADGRDWDWATAFTAQGGYADALVLGILSDKTGANYWNLDTGEFSLSSSAGIGDETAGSILTKISANAGAIISEVKRAERAEEGLGSRIAQTAEAVTSEVARAEKEEKSLSSRITQTAEAVISEVTRAEKEEKSLGSRITQTAEAVTSEVTRAKEAENSLDSKITQTAESITTEVSKAETHATKQYGTCSTAASTVAKTVACAGFELYTGATISVKFTYANTAVKPTLNVNGTGAKTIYAYGDTLSSTSSYNWPANAVVAFVYDGTYWRMSEGGAYSKIVQAAEDIQLSVTNGTDRSTLQLSGGYIEAQSVTIKFTGDVVFKSDLGSSGSTTVNGSRISGGTLKLGGRSNGNGILEIYDASGTLIGKWDNAGFFTDGKYFAVTEAGEMYSNDPVAVGGLYMAGTVGYTLNTEGAKKVRARVMNVGFSTSSSAATGNYSLYIGDNDSAVGWEVTKINVRQPTSFSKEATFSSNLKVSGTKSRAVDTEGYGTRLQYCYEMPSPLFGDVGEGQTDEDGECVVYLDDVFSETVRLDIEYQVFLQKEGPGDLWVQEKTPVYFLVKGTGNLKFSWEIKARQKGYECERLEEDADRGLEYQRGPENAMLEEAGLLGSFWEAMENAMADELETVFKEKEAILNEAGETA